MDSQAAFDNFNCDETVMKPTGVSISYMTTRTELAVGTTERTLKGNLGVADIVLMVVAAAAPLTVIGGGTPIGILIGNGAGFPFNFVLCAAILLVFSVGLSTMARTIPKPGAFFTYIGYGLGRPAGVGAAWVALLCYTTVQLAVYGYLGYSLSADLSALGAPAIPWWVYSLAMIGVVGVLGYRDIQLSAKVLGVFLICEIGITLLLSTSVIVNGGADGLSLTTFAPTSWLSGSPGIGLMMAMAGFIGFESTAVFRDEARDPDRTIPRATYTAVIVIGVLYSFAAWALVMAWGPDNVVAAAAEDPGTMLLRTATQYMGVAGSVVIQGLLLTSLFACVLSFHNVLTRYQHTMGSVGLLPRSLSIVHPVHHSPSRSSLIQTATAAIVLSVLTLLGWDPVMQIFSWLSGIATISIVVLMALTSIAVAVHFKRHGLPSSRWATKVAPILAAVALMAVAAIIVFYFPDLVGGGWDLALVLLVTVPLFMAIGYVQALRIRKSKPEVYENIIDSIS